ncbi:MAG: RsmB/NOP family class I SAM-dependent RNA methyltransferase [Roseovarius sp.]|uniref:RsmB/NOP family class I SAM-dependent RNA methyltransferase n=1 Tax=Roseovarius sp. TaxID=1486281 RepID=UPI0032EAACE2
MAAAIAVLDQVLDGQPAEQSLTRWARGARYAGSKDRAAVRDHVFQALRCLRSYACLGGARTGRGVMIGAIRAEDTDPETLFTGEVHAPAPLTPEERTAGAPPEADGDRLDLPDWLVTAFRETLGNEAEAAAHALRSRAPVTLRVNIRLKNLSQAIEFLKEEGISAHPVDIAPTALIVSSGARRIAGSAAYRDGIVELQDGSSQAAMHALTLAPGSRVLDYCAGGGGKTLALAARHDATWFAHDAEPARMKDLPPRAARAGCDVTLLSAADLAGHATYDLVLCDVPCSGSGTWRRAPEAKWRLAPGRLSELTKLQTEILERAAALVRPGGTLVYTTCSILRAENEEKT